MMLDRRATHSRLAAATLRRIAALALSPYCRDGLRTIAAPSLVAAVPVEHADHRPSI
jgi:hypothetical protein